MVAIADWRGADNCESKDYTARLIRGKRFPFSHASKNFLAVCIIVMFEPCCTIHHSKLPTPIYQVSDCEQWRRYVSKKI